MNSSVFLNAFYSDKRGREQIVFENNGTLLKTKIRGFDFSGEDFDCLSIQNIKNQESLPFNLSKEILIDCKLEIAFHLPVIVSGEEVSGILYALIELGQKSPSGGLTHEILKLSLKYADQEICSLGNSGFFEDEFLLIQKKLDDKTWIKCCFNCLYSDYHPAGQGLFGSMMCFQNMKDDYLKVKSKEDFFKIIEKKDRFVQETFLCQKFLKRIPGTGYRG